MSFREKSAWISFVCLLLLTVACVAATVHHPHDAEGHLHLALAVFGAFGLLQVVLHLIVVAQAPKDARTPKDERELLIELRAARVGFYALVIAEVLAMAGVHVHGSWGTFMGTVLIAILIAWLVKLGTEITLYRRGG
jgi:hypothetical protein